MLKNLLNSIRRNHALEHATITLMIAKHGPMRVVGRAGTDGFYVWANVTTEMLQEFAHEALGRLQKGEAHLAVTPLCGTNVAVAGVLSGGAAFLASSGRRSGLDGLSRAVIAAMFAMLAAPSVGRLIQKNYTTSPDLEGVRIVGIDAVRRTLHKVRTAPA